MGNAMTSRNLKVMEPADLVSDILKGLASDTLEMVPGQSRPLRLLSRIMPGYLIRLLAVGYTSAEADAARTFWLLGHIPRVFLAFCIPWFVFRAITMRAPYEVPVLQAPAL